MKNTLNRLTGIMEKHPELNIFGMGIYFEYKKLSQKEQAAVLQKGRQELIDAVDRVEATINWLSKNIDKRKSINLRHTSYGRKHVVEKHIGYISNGVFIAAAMILEYPYKIQQGRPNVKFGMSEKSWNKIEGYDEI